MTTRLLAALPDHTPEPEPAPTCVTLFSGFGLFAVGAQDAGYDLIGAWEHNAAIAAIYAYNLGAHVQVRDLTRVTIREFRAAGPAPYLLQASPECTRASRANRHARESGADWRQAGAICRALVAWHPPAFLLENVPGYRTFRSYGRILAYLTRLGYRWDARLINAADYGVPQTRVRLIVRAVRGDRPLPLLQPTHSRHGDLFTAPWAGWYDAIADLIPDLPRSRPARWQVARMPVDLTTSALFGNNQSDDHKGTPLGYGVPYRPAPTPALTVRTGRWNLPYAFLLAGAKSPHGDTLDLRTAAAPAPTVDATQPRHPVRAFIVGGGNTQLAQVDSHARTADEPMFTVAARRAIQTRAWLLDGGHAGLRPAETPAGTVVGAPGSGTGALRAWMTAGYWVQLTARALARIQTLGDGFVLPANRDLACTGIGNGVPCRLAAHLARSLWPPAAP